MKALAVLLIVGCASAPVMPVVITPTTEAVPTTSNVYAVVADTVFHDWFVDLYHHYPEVETALCVYGVVNSKGQAVVLFTRPVPIDTATINKIKFKGACFRPNPVYLGALRYLGIVHNHPNNSCNPSEPDIESFRKDVDAVAEMVICRSGLNAVGRK